MFQPCWFDCRPISKNSEVEIAKLSNYSVKKVKGTPFYKLNKMRNR